MGVRPPAQMRLVPRAFSRDCTEDSDMSFSGEMKDEPAIKPLALYEVEDGIAMEPMKGKCASSRIYLACTELFCIPVVTSVIFFSCDNILGDSLVFHQAH